MLTVVPGPQRPSGAIGLKLDVRQLPADGRIYREQLIPISSSEHIGSDGRECWHAGTRAGIRRNPDSISETIRGCAVFNRTDWLSRKR